MRIASYVLRILGILLAAFGIVLVFIGKNMNDEFYVQIEYYYQHGTFDSTGNAILYGGIGMAAAGIIMLIISIFLSFRLHRQLSHTVNEEDYDEFDDMVAQLAGNKTIFDVFHTEDNTRIFSFYRDKTCILKSGDEIRRGKMEPLEWDDGHPTLWRRTLDFDGKKESCDVSKVEGNILVKCKSGEQLFYRGAVNT